VRKSGTDIALEAIHEVFEEPIIEQKTESAVMAQQAKDFLNSSLGKRYKTLVSENATELPVAAHPLMHRLMFKAAANFESTLKDMKKTTLPAEVFMRVVSSCLEEEWPQ
jgi:hypothetical protein